jgi:hypothetical protein
MVNVIEKTFDKNNKEIEKKNKIDIEIFAVDTIDTILSRIASKINTIPKYIYISNIENIENIEDVEDILLKIKNFTKERRGGTNFTVFLNSNKELINSLITRTKYKIEMIEIMKLFIVYNENISEIKEKYEYEILSILNEYEKTKYTDKITFDKLEYFWKERKSIKQEIEKKIEKNKNDINVWDNLIISFTNENIEYESTDFELLKISYYIQLLDKTGNPISISEVFNLIRLNNNIVPFSSYFNYFKIFKEFIPNDEWIQSFEDIIYIKVLKNIYNKDTNYSDVYIQKKDYSDVFIQEKESKILVNFEIDTTKGVDKKIYIEYLLSIFSKNNIEQLYIGGDIIQEGINGVFYYPNKRINIYVLSDMILNNKLISKYCHVDESLKSSKEKMNLHIFFDNFDEKIGKITFNISSKTTDYNDQEMKNKDKKLFVSDSPYIRIRILKAKNETSINLFKEFFSKLLKVYYDEENKVINFYKQFIPDFGNIEEIIPTSKKNVFLKDILSFFGSKYGRQCSHLPEIATEEDEKSNSQIIKFPKEEISGIKPTNFICKDNVYKYPGLKKNTNLETIDKIPYLPCCYKNDHSKNKYELSYYHNKELIKTTKKTTYIKTSSKALEKNNTGILPSNLNKLFKILDNNNDYSRKGFSDITSSNSFINCIDSIINKSIKNDENIKKIRKSFTEDIKLIASCKQEMYDYSIQNIIDEIDNENNYFDPKKFIRLLEIRYKCNIYLFSNEENEKMILPRYSQHYYKMYEKLPSIFIFINKGSSGQTLPYLHCEAIIRSNTKSLSFDYDDKISIGINKIFNELNTSYILDKKIIQINTFPWGNKEDIKLLSQSFDEYGKTRIVYIEYNNNQIPLIMNPIQPLYLIEEDNKNNKPINYDEDDILKLFEYLDIKFKTIQNNLMIGEYEDGFEISVILNEETLNITNSELVIFNNNKKLSRYYTEYLYWLYSKYINENENNSVDDFFTNKIIIKQIDYNDIVNKINNIFTENCPILNSNKLIIENENMKEKLRYVLELSLLRNKKGIENYYTHSKIKDYYLYISDFDIWKNQVLLYGKETVDNWISEKHIKYYIYDTVVPIYNYPYFFKNDNIDDKIYLIQNESNIQDSISRSINWNKFKINKIDKNITKFDYSYIFYFFESVNNIHKYLVNGKENDFDIKIIGCKYKNINYFSCLLDL